jgi:formylglycine-generating enzyme required for sulfatase activity
VIAFIEDGGYRRPDLWLSAGWDIVQTRGWQAPYYWQQPAGGDTQASRWHAFTLRGLVEVSPDAPAAHLSQYEADAIARWLGARLPTEFEWEHVAQRVPVEGNLLETGLLHPAEPLTAAPPGLPGQMFGDVWEWTQSAYLPYPGYRTALSPAFDLPQFLPAGCALAVLRRPHRPRRQLTWQRRVIPRPHHPRDNHHS